MDAISKVAPVPRMSLGDAVYERLLEAILTGTLAAGEELSEVALAAQFQVSRTPVREALRRLAADGLVASGPNRPSTVVQFSRDDVTEIYQVRRFLESGAASLACARIEESELARLQATARQAGPDSGSGWHQRALDFDADFHRTIAQAAGNQRLLQEILRYSHCVRIMQRLGGRRGGRMEMAHREHLQILAALQRRDAQAAADAMDRHIASALEILLEDIYPAESPLGSTADEPRRAIQQGPSYRK